MRSRDLFLFAVLVLVGVGLLAAAAKADYTVCNGDTCYRVRTPVANAIRTTAAVGRNVTARVAYGAPTIFQRTQASYGSTGGTVSYGSTGGYGSTSLASNAYLTEQLLAERTARAKAEARATAAETEVTELRSELRATQLGTARAPSIDDSSAVQRKAPDPMVRLARAPMNLARVARAPSPFPLLQTNHAPPAVAAVTHAPPVVLLAMR